MILLEIWFATAKQVPLGEKATDRGVLPTPAMLTRSRLHSELTVNIEILLVFWFATAKQLAVGEKATDIGDRPGRAVKGLPGAGCN